jgi:glycosyltransferase involved in cell wall biosynthesis
VPKVSLTLPCFDCAATLPACLDSLLAQTLGDFEIVAVDDGSTDATAGVLAEYARRDSRLRPILAPHRGLVAALNAALAACRSGLVARMDADDVAAPERLAVQVRHLDEHPGVGLVGCRVAFGGDREKSGGYARYVDWQNRLLSFEQVSVNRFVESPFAHPSILFRRELVERFGGYRQGPFPEDYELILRWLEAGVRMEKVPQTLLVWNDPATRLSRSDPRYATRAFYEVKTGYLARFLARHNPHHPRVVVLGAGRETRRRADLLLGHGVTIEAYLDIDPRKVGRVVRGRPVRHREQLPGPGAVFCLSYVASRGAREDIEAFLTGRGYRAGRDFLLAA